MTEKDSPFPSNREELADFLHKLFDKLQTLLQKLFERGRTFVQNYMEQRKTKDIRHWHLRRMPSKVVAVLSHWHKLIEGFQESPQRIYSLLEEAIDRREIPDVKISRINYPEAGVLSARREYLRVQRMDHVFDVCAAPFGTGFFFSWWLGVPRRLLRSIIWFLLIVFVPIVGLIIVIFWWLSLRETYYRLDTALMFQDTVHSAVLEVIGQVTEGKGLKAMTELEKKPIMSDLFKRKLK
jgi:hypothetical protein